MLQQTSGGLWEMKTATGIMEKLDVHGLSTVNTGNT